MLTAAMLLLLYGCGKAREPEEITEAPETDGVTVTYYHGDKYGDHLIEETTLIPRLTAQAVVDLLVEQKVIPEGTTVRNFRLYNGIITLDLSKEFEKEAQSLRSSGEYVLMGSLVNTFLSTYEARGMELTTEGRKLATGHDIYDYVLEFYE